LESIGTNRKRRRITGMGRGERKKVVRKGSGAGVKPLAVVNRP